jgi:hypothetical protein
VSRVDLKWALLELEGCTAARAAAAGVPLEVLPADGSADGRALVRVRTACANGNPVLSPAMVLELLNSGAAAAQAHVSLGSSSSSSSGGANEGIAGEGSVAGSADAAFALAHIHRSDIRLRPMAVPQPDWLKLRSLCRWVAAPADAAHPWRPCCCPAPPHTLWACPPLNLATLHAVHHAAGWRATWLRRRSAAAAPGPAGWRSGRCSWSERRCCDGVVVNRSAQHATPVTASLFQLLRHLFVPSQSLGYPPLNKPVTLPFTLPSIHALLGKHGPRLCKAYIAWQPVENLVKAILISRKTGSWAQRKIAGIRGGSKGGATRKSGRNKMRARLT